MDLNHVGTRDSQQLRVSMMIIMEMVNIITMTMEKVKMMTTIDILDDPKQNSDMTCQCNHQQHRHLHDDNDLQNELEARVGLMGGDSLEESDKSWWESHKSWITITIFLLIILATIIVIVFIAFGGLNAT